LRGHFEEDWLPSVTRKRREKEIKGFQKAKTPPKLIFGYGLAWTAFCDV